MKIRPWRVNYNAYSGRLFARTVKVNSHGFVTSVTRRKIRAQNHQSKRLFREKHDKQVRN